MLETRTAELKRMFASLGPVTAVGEYSDAYAGEAAEPDFADRAAWPGGAGDWDEPGSGLGDELDAESGIEDESADPYIEIELEDVEDEDPGPDDRTETLISHGRVNAAPRRTKFLRAHWKVLSAAAAVVIALVITLAAVTGGSAPASWPSSVSQMQSEITVACQNPDVAAEPSQVDFACGTGTRQVLWVFALL
ncbi:MAG TPA: hypothetical protein VGG75_38705, partial [Trebonia sp.]